MKAFGFEVRLAARRLPPPRPQAIMLSLVRMAASGYSVPIGTVGVVEDSSEGAEYHFVRWVTGGGSGPISEADLERLGEISVSLEATDR